MKIFIYWGELTFTGGKKNLVRGNSTGKSFFVVGGMSKFLASGG